MISRLSARWIAVTANRAVTVHGITPTVRILMRPSCERLDRVSAARAHAPGRILPTYERRARNPRKTLGSGKLRRRRDNRPKRSGASWLSNRCFTGARITQAAADIVRPAADERFAAPRKGGRIRPAACAIRCRVGIVGLTKQNGRLRYAD